MTSPVVTPLSLELSDAEIKAELDVGHHLISVAELAHMFKKKPATIRSYFNNGWLRGVKVNTMWHTIEPEVLRYIREGKFQNGGQDSTRSAA